VIVVHRSTDNFTLQVRTSQEFFSHTLKNEWVVYSRCTHHMAKYPSLFSSLEKYIEGKIYVDDVFYLNTICHGDVPC
jgi:hypothetical protein